jgi:hypothetical protein
MRMLVQDAGDPVGILVTPRLAVADVLRAEQVTTMRTLMPHAGTALVRLAETTESRTGG